MASGPCIADTNSVDLGQDGSGNLTADVRLHPAGALVVDGSGVFVGVASTGGLQIASDRLSVKPQGPGLAQDAGGIAKIQNYGSVGWVPGLADDVVVHNFAVARGALSQVGGVVTVPLAINQTIPTAVHCHCYWSLQANTTYSEFSQPTNVFDSVTAYLQGNYDNTGWVTIDQFGLDTFRQSLSFTLSGEIGAFMANATAHSLQTRLVVLGGVLSATAIQGYIGQSYHRGIQVWW